MKAMADLFVAVLMGEGGHARSVTAPTLEAVRAKVLSTFDASFHNHALTIERQSEAGVEIVAQGPMGQVIVGWAPAND